MLENTTYQKLDMPRPYMTKGRHLPPELALEDSTSDSEKTLLSFLFVYF
jgi:hypothetical protein